jgi:hypothetical protein
MKHLRAVAVTLMASMPLFVFAAGEKLNNPLNATYSSVPGLIAGFMRVVVMIALPAIALFLVYAGLMYVSARGNHAKITTAHANFKYTIIGATLLLGGWAFALMIWGTLGPLLGVGTGGTGGSGGSNAPGFQGGAIQTLDGQPIRVDIFNGQSGSI